VCHLCVCVNYQHFFESVVHRLFVHSLDNATLLLDLVEIVAGMRPGHGVAARIAARPTPTAGFLRPAEPCVQLQQSFNNFDLLLIY